MIEDKTSVQSEEKEEEKQADAGTLILRLSQAVTCLNKNTSIS
jgi:hypothetical protein